MYPNDHSCSEHSVHRCCGCSGLDVVELSRRTFLEGAVLGGTALTGLSWPALAAMDGMSCRPRRRDVRSWSSRS